LYGNIGRLPRANPEVMETAMNRLVKTTILSAAVAAATLSALAPADARDRRHHGEFRHSSSKGDLIVAGLLGLAVGAIAADALSDPAPQYSEPLYEEPIYDEYDRAPPPPRPRPHRPFFVDPDPSVVQYQPSLEPWSPEWFRYCGDRYGSFNPDTGTYLGYDGLNHFCVAN
jgi:BA14K-like protein